MAELKFPRAVLTSFGQEVDPCTREEFADLLAQGVVADHAPSKKSLPTEVESTTPYATPVADAEPEDDGTVPESPAKKG